MNSEGLFVDGPSRGKVVVTEDSVVYLNVSPLQEYDFKHSKSLVTKQDVVLTYRKEVLKVTTMLDWKKTGYPSVVPGAYFIWVLGTGLGRPSTDELLQLIAESGVKPRQSFGTY